jgi:predicted membrane-bound spermidine synthase
MSNGQFQQNSLIRAGVLVCFFLSGTAGLVYEIVWMRMLGLIFGHTVFALTTVLAAFMAGLALGAYLFGKLIDRKGRPLQVYGLLEAGIGLYVLIVPFLFRGAQVAYLTLPLAGPLVSHLRPGTVCSGFGHPAYPDNVDGGKPACLS